MAKKEATSISYRTGRSNEHVGRRAAQRVINIDADVHQAFKDYCDKNGLRMSPTATKIILAAIEKKSSKSVDTGR